MGNTEGSAASGTELVDKQGYPSPAAPSEFGTVGYHHPSELSGDWQQRPSELPAR